MNCLIRREFTEGQGNITDCQQRRTRKMRKLTEIKQKLSDREENEDGSVKSVTSLNHSNSQLTAIKQEESCISRAEDGVHPNEMTASLTCQVKTEHQSEEEDECELQSTAVDYPHGFVIKREIIEIHAEDHHMMDDQVNRTKSTEDSETETNDIVVKSENENSSPNFPGNYIEKQENMFELTRKMNEQKICRRIGEETEMSHTPAQTFHKIKKNHVCSVCGKAFHSRQSCLQHMLNKHKGGKPHSCELCGKGFKYLSTLETHKAVHADERPYSCNVCEKAFRQKAHLDTHKTVHSEERPYSCDVCKKAFKQKANLHTHKTLVHSDKRPYSCDVCNKSFKCKLELQKHKVACHSIETPYSCDLCKRMFKLKENIIKHINAVHSEERAYSCDVCKNTFKQKSYLQTHKMLCHSNERSYSCDLCKRTLN